MDEDFSSSSIEREWIPTPIPPGTLVVVYTVGIGPITARRLAVGPTIRGLVVSSPPPGANIRDTYEVQLETAAEQLRVADGQVLSRTGRIEANGHSIECRINAEDPAFDFRPAAGRLDDFRLAAGPGVRVDTYCRSGGYVPPYYDSLLAKLCVWAPDRARAVARMRRALDESVVTGVPTMYENKHTHKKQLQIQVDRASQIQLSKVPGLTPPTAGSVTP